MSAGRRTARATSDDTISVVHVRGGVARGGRGGGEAQCHVLAAL